MFPLLVFSVISVAIIIERAISIGAAHIPKSKLSPIIGALERNDMEGAKRHYAGLKGAAANVGSLILRYQHLPKEELESIVSRAGSLELKALTKYLHLLELIGKISPMVGLSGTVLGLAFTFQKVASLKSMADPSALASGIWEALITTVSGLFVAIPAIIFYHLYENRIKSISFEMKVHSETVLSLVKEGPRKALPGDKP